VPERDCYIWQKGEPSPEIVAELEKQNATYRIEPNPKYYTKYEQSELKALQSRYEPLTLIPVENTADMPF
jgi:hypothetical protein